MSIKSTVNKSLFENYEKRDYSQYLQPVPQAQASSGGVTPSAGGGVAFGDVEVSGSNFTAIKPLDLSGLGSPVDNPNVTSPFGKRAANLATYYQIDGTEFHTGVDFGGAENSNVLATLDGKVTRVLSSGYNQGLGHTVTLEHEVNGEKIFSRYNHVGKIDVKVGDVVSKGQRIAGMSSTGNSTGTHLDYQVYRAGNGKQEFLNTNTRWL